MDNTTTPKLDMDAVRARLAGKRGKQYWRSLGELLETRETQEFLADEIPQTTRTAGLHVDRRRFLSLAGASLALAGLSGCRFKEQKKLVPYVHKPEELIEGIPLFYATTIPSIGGYGLGALVTSREGRPIKLEGNPDHPASLGKLDALGQASLLSLYDPDRAQIVTNNGEVSSWRDFFNEARTVMSAQRAVKGAGLRILSETITSPTLANQRATLLREFPEAKWVQYEPAGRDNVRAGVQAAFGTTAQPVYDFTKATRLLSLDCDFLMSMPGSVRYSAEFIGGRKVREGIKPETLNRLYVIECSPSITGAMADHKLTLRPSQIEAVTRAIATGLGVGPNAGAAPKLDEATQKFVTALVADLKGATKGSTLVVPGDFQSPAVHVLAHAMNAALGNVGNTLTYTEPVEVDPSIQFNDLATLTDELQQGKVEALIVIGGNPVYTAPANLDFKEQIRKPAFRVHLGLFEDETSALCQWHLPEAHFLEAWGDLRAYNGTASIVQPIIAPLYDGKSAIEVLSGLIDQPHDGFTVVSDYWAKQGFGGSNDFNKILHDGVIPNTAAKPKAVTLKADALTTLTPSPDTNLGTDAIEVTLRPDPNIWDGRHSNNGWLQELPKPFVKLTWDNAAYMSPDTAAKFHITVDKEYAASSDIIELSFKDTSVNPPVERKEMVPVIIQPGVPEDTVNLFLGYGRTRAGSLGNDIGYNAYNLFTSLAPWHFTATLRRTDNKYPLAVTVHHQTMEGRDLIRVGSIAQFQRKPSLAPEEGAAEPAKEGTAPVGEPTNKSEAPQEEQPNIYNAEEWKWPADGDAAYGAYKWGLSVDLSSCIGCNACLVACQAENNIPIVGKQQVLVGRHMNWIRIDTYYETSTTNVSDYLKNPSTYFQPIMCMQCEQAPCEPVCPVAATIHSSEGLNQMIYNRCLGTKYCSNNCPYKVRRFNFLNYANHWDIAVVKLRNNPEVTVRGRGVMEKCSYCVQRINSVRQKAKQQEREIEDGEIQTACQQTCPTNAIVFGNINDKNSAVSKLKEQPHDYGLLADLNTRPRTTYLGRVRNPNPDLEEHHVG